MTSLYAGRSPTECVHVPHAVYISWHVSVVYVVLIPFQFACLATFGLHRISFHVYFHMSVSETAGSVNVCPSPPPEIPQSAALH